VTDPAPVARYGRRRAIAVYFLKTGSPAHLRWLKVFEPLMVITGIV
jgi:hypothetical protein